MTIRGTYAKQPAEVKSYVMDFTEWLEGDTIDQQTTEVIGGDSALTVVSSAIVIGAKAVKVVLGAGTTGQKYKIQITATTALGGLVEQEEFYVTVKEV
jgi:hypothetical protein